MPEASSLEHHLSLTVRQVLERGKIPDGMTTRGRFCPKEWHVGHVPLEMTTFCDFLDSPGI
ncbi:MAG: hypothetical protein ACE5IR_24735, partial [bacterium]